MNCLLNKFFVFFLLAIVGWGVSSTTFADKDSTRIRIGLKLFRTILAADTQIKEKKTADGVLELALIYKNNQSDAVLYSKKLQKLGKGKNQGKIKKIPIKINIFSTQQLQQLTHFKPAGIYLVEEIDKNRIEELVNYGIKHQIIIYSPFAGAVEQGVTAGLIIDARVKPYLNSQTLQTSQLKLKPFFLKVSKQYEP
jgi:hypothetical protein